MSQVRYEMVWQPEQVLPYLFDGLKTRIEALTPVRSMYLYGSRARTPQSRWNELEGKDWDVLVVCDYPIVKTHIWTQAENYHIDLTITDAVGAASYFEHVHTVELYPENRLEVGYGG